uniref:Uncharacterized protein n=1 Tax=Anopheles quadriannulatus TaxID=34691 RepID=A0A182XR67_ANOQN
MGMKYFSPLYSTACLSSWLLSPFCKIVFCITRSTFALKTLCCPFDVPTWNDPRGVELSFAWPTNSFAVVDTLRSSLGK